MIAASRRRRQGREDAFRLHLELAGRAAWSVRLRRGAVGALVASLAALLLRAGATEHLAACVVGFAAGVAIPVRGVVAEALGSIRRRAGLSYETALGLLDSEAEDEFGLHGSVVERARLAVRDVRPEQAPAWWLPALAVALGLTLFSLGGPLLGPRGTAGNGGASGGPAAGPPEVPAAAQQDRQDEDVTPPEDAPGRAAEEPDSQQRDEDDSAEGQGATPPSGDVGGDAPLSRFLDSLRERPSSPPDQDQAGAPGNPGQQPPRAEGPTSPGDERGDAQRVDLDRQTSSGDGEAGTDPQQEQAEGQSEGEPDGGDQGDGEDQQGQPGSGESGDDPGQGQPQAGDQPDGEGGAMPDAGGEPGESQGDSQSAGLTPDDGSAEDALEAVGAGAGGGNETDAGVAQAQGGDPELLPGVLQDGPENPAGTVRLPGDAEVSLPPGRAPVDYQAAAEEALTEGDLPLEYQEIIRQYFQ